jgi:Rrf2 family iron-sulfur cluster assembly transcriptional regulator
MRIGSKGRYAVIALIDVASNSGARPVALAEVAERQHISLSYLEQLFAMLRRSGLVVSSRGPGGGYKPNRPAGEISIGEVFRAVEETGNGSEPGRDWTADGSVSAGLWMALDDHIREFLEGVTVADVMAGKVNGHLANGSAGIMAGGLSAPSKLA